MSGSEEGSGKTSLWVLVVQRYVLGSHPVTRCQSHSYCGPRSDWTLRSQASLYVKCRALSEFGQDRLPQGR